MRWDDQLLHPPAGEQGNQTDHLPLFDEGAVVRRFDTPEFRGMTFYEVQARSIINHLSHDRFGFRHTINPYRGCAHACAYCLHGDTPILLADGRTRAIRDLNVGDLVYGTARRGSYRRYVATEVLAHWRTTKAAYRITLEDGTALIASADHRFLSNRGWKHVVGAECCPHRRSHLTIGNRLLGTGAFPEGPKSCLDYRSGYLTGIIRGHGNLNRHSCQSQKGNAGEVHRFRLALADVEGLLRTRRILSDLGIETQRFVFRPASARGQDVQAIGISQPSHIEALRDLIGFPPEPGFDWIKGFLAGIFDSQGSYSRGILRMGNRDPSIVDQTKRGLDALGFRTTVETVHRPEPISYVRLLGGLAEHLRFFLVTDPAISRKRQIDRQVIKSRARLEIRSIEPLGLELPMVDITTGTGDFVANGVVSHNCFARPTHTYLDFDAGRDFETKIVVKTNAAELLRKELRRPSWTGEHIAMGTNTDNYQRAEGRYRLMRGILAELNAARNPYSILTKSTLIQRDLDLLVEGASVTEVSTAFSVGTVDEEAWRRSEPGTPHPLKRLEVVRKLNLAGVRCGVLMAPILPGISDAPEQLEATVQAIAASGATSLTPIVLYLRPGFREEFMAWLAEAYPDLVAGYRKMYRTSNAPKSVTEAIHRRVQRLKQAHDWASPSHARARRGAHSIEAAPQPDQLSLEI